MAILTDEWEINMQEKLKELEEEKRREEEEAVKRKVLTTKHKSTSKSLS